MGEFIYKLQRTAGGEPAVLRVTDENISLTIPSSITDTELETLKSIEALAIALKRGVSLTQSQPAAENGAHGN